MFGAAEETTTDFGLATSSVNAPESPVDNASGLLAPPVWFVEITTPWETSMLPCALMSRDRPLVKMLSTMSKAPGSLSEFTPTRGPLVTLWSALESTTIVPVPLPMSSNEYQDKSSVLYWR